MNAVRLTFEDEYMRSVLRQRFEGGVGHFTFSPGLFG
jgi:hypothetical protein